MNPERMQELLELDIRSGIVLRKKTKRKLLPDFGGLCAIYDPLTKKTTKIKLNKVVFALAYGILIGNNQRILHRNMQEDDFRLTNLVQVHKEQYNAIKEAYRNLMYAIKIIPHQEDMFSYYVQYYEKGVLRNKLVQDSQIAKKVMLGLKLKYSKILTEYCVFED